MEERRKKKKGTTLPFAISSEPAVETRRGKRQSWSTLCTRNYGFRRVPKGKGFSYTSYFLPSCHVRAIFSSALILGLCLLTVKTRIQYFDIEILELLATPCVALVTIGSGWASNLPIAMDDQSRD